MNRDYVVFISHAGPDKETIAIPLYNRLRERKIPAFVDREELHVGDNGPRVMEYAMNTARVGVFILSPEFAARNWTMAELMCFQKRERDAIKENRPLPILIPVFYRLDISTCRNVSKLFHTNNESGENAFLAETFFERAAEDNISVAQVTRAMKQISMRTGIENNGMATNAVEADTRSLRSTLIDGIVDKIEAAVTRVKASGAEDDAVRYWRTMEHATEVVIAGASVPGVSYHAEQDSFSPYFEVWENPSYVVFGTNASVSDNAEENPKAKALGILLNEQSQGHVMLAIQGMPGVGKTCTLRALCHDRGIRSRFKDGVYVIRLGVDAVLQAFLAGLSGVVEESGGHCLASGMGKNRSLESAVTSGKKWFVNRTFLFLVDDVWSKPADGARYLQCLSRICAAGKGSAVVFSTREKDLLLHRTVTHEFQIFSHEPRSDISRTILLQSCIGDRNSTVLPATKIAMTGLLDYCCGLPVALAVTGRAIRKLAIDMGRDYDRALETYYYNMKENNAPQVVSRRSDEYPSLSASLLTSMNVLDQIWDAHRGAPLPYSSCKMHGGLCVLKKQQWAPLSMLRCLWNLPSIQDTSVVVDQLSEVGLVDVHFRKVDDDEIKGVQLHDLVHDVATQNSAEANEERTWHARLLHAYASVGHNKVQMHEGCREWWKAERDTGKYFEENVVRHLIAAGDISEAALLVTRPQWIARQVESCTILSFERDTELLMHTFETCSDWVANAKETREGLALIRNCVLAGLGAILCNPREAYFQIYARMMYAKESSPFADKIVKYAERHAVKPYLKNISACVQQAETVGGKRFSCSEARCLRVVEERGIVIVGFYRGGIVVFDMETCERKADWAAHDARVYCLAVTTDRRFLVSGSDDKTAKAWDMENGFAEVSVCQFVSSIYSVDVMPDNQLFVVGDGGGNVSVWELETGRCVVPVLGRHETRVTSVAVSPDGKIIASGDLKGAIKMWAMSDRVEMDSTPLTETEDKMGSAPPTENISPRTETENKRKGLRLRRILTRFRGTKRSESELGAETPDETDNDPSDPYAVATPASHTHSILSLCFTKDGRKLISGSNDGTVRQWDRITETQVGEVFCKHKQTVSSVSVIEGDQRIFSVGNDGTMCVWKLEGSLERRIQFLEGVSVIDARIIAGGDNVIWYNDDLVQITEVRSDLSAHGRSSQHEGAVSAICMTPYGTRVITGSWDNTLKVWGTATGVQVERTIDRHKGCVHDVAVTPDGQRFVSVSWDKTVRVWNFATVEQLAILYGHSTWVNCVEVSLNGKVAITGSWDKTVRIWDLKTCDGSHQVLEGHSAAIFCLRLAQDRQHFVSLSDEDAIMWNMEGKKMKRVEKEDAFRMAAEDVEEWFRIPLVSSLRMGQILLGRDWNRITYEQNGAKKVLATLDSYIWSMDFSAVTKRLCVGLKSGVVGIFKLELDDGSVTC